MRRLPIASSAASMSSSRDRRRKSTTGAGVRPPNPAAGSNPRWSFCVRAWPGRSTVWRPHRRQCHRTLTPWPVARDAGWFRDPRSAPIAPQLEPPRPLQGFGPSAADRHRARHILRHRDDRAVVVFLEASLDIRISSPGGPLRHVRRAQERPEESGRGRGDSAPRRFPQVPLESLSYSTIQGKVLPNLLAAQRGRRFSRRASAR